MSIAEAGARQDRLGVRLRALREEDLTALATWWCHDEVLPMQSEWPVPQPVETLVERFRTWGRNDPADGSCALGVEVDGSLAGYVAVMGPGLPSRTGELAIMLAPEVRGKGVGRAAMEQLLTGLRRIGPAPGRDSCLLVQHASCSPVCVTGFRGGGTPPRTGLSSRPAA